MMRRNRWYRFIMAGWLIGMLCPINAAGVLDGFTVADRPNDEGDAIVITLPEIPESVRNQLQGFKVYRSESPEGPFAAVGLIEPGATEYVDCGKQFSDSDDESESDSAAEPFKMKTPYYYQLAEVYHKTGESVFENHFPLIGLVVRFPQWYNVKLSTPQFYRLPVVLGKVDPDEPLTYEVRSAVVGPVEALPHWYHTGKTTILIGTVLLFVLVGVFIQVARTGRSMYVRPIAGMNEIDNAIGRATEMGKPILYVLGLGGPDEIATIASYTILARVARKTAEYQTDIIVPCDEPIVMTIAQETVKNAYAESGHIDAYSEDMVFYVTSLQFAYVAAVNGIMLREKTATNCYFGKFYAESLLLSETGNIAGSIQVAGTDEVAQLPFFITTCDYTLIGEELYAASAYLGRDPLLLGALKAQDVAKAIVMILIIIGSILISLNITWLKDLITVIV
ncbi:MAG: DUF6754 domain-containing protein [bacterium]